MVDMDPKGFHQLLLSPVFLLNQILAIIVPGALLMLLLGLKGNITLLNAWLNSPFGYKTKVAIFILLAYVVGSVLRIPILSLRVLRKAAPPEPVSPFLKGQTPEVQKMLIGIIGDGVLLSTPGLIDRLSLIQTDSGFHMGTGMALLIAATRPGDGSLRWLEALLGVAMFWTGVVKARNYSDQTLSMIGVGWANILGRMTPQQLEMAKAVFNSLKPTDAVPEVVLESSQADSQKGLEVAE